MYSFFSQVHKTYSRIDHFFLDKRILYLINKCEYGAIVVSDHAPLSMKILIPTSQRTYRPWRLNSLLLSEEDFVKYISSEINMFLNINQTQGMSPSTVWESLKAYLRGQIISFCANKRKERTEHLRVLTDKILETDILCSHSPTANVFKKRLELQTEFNLLSTHQAEYLISKSRHSHYEHGEKARRALARQLRQRTANQTILAVNDEHGQKYTDNGEINSCFKKFYHSLYSSDSPADPCAIDDFFKPLNIPSINAELVNELESDITTAEITAAIKAMQSGKSPGPDGFPTEFYKKFADQLSPLLLSVFEESFSLGALPPTMRQAVISLLLKKDKNPLNCSSYRPISLLNTDAKILAKLQAHRLEAAVDFVISPDQTGFIKGRYSFFNIRRLCNILYSAN